MKAKDEGKSVEVKAASEPRKASRQYPTLIPYRQIDELTAPRNAHMAMEQRPHVDLNIATAAFLQRGIESFFGEHEDTKHHLDSALQRAGRTERVLDIYVQFVKGVGDDTSHSVSQLREAARLLLGVMW